MHGSNAAANDSVFRALCTNLLAYLLTYLLNSVAIKCQLSLSHAAET